MKIALYGGSFNPPHLGHREAALSVLRELKPDKFLIIPDNIPPHKELDENSPTAQERLELCRLAFRDLPGAEVSDLELRRSGRSYTADTVRELKALYPEDELIFVMGTDMLLSFEQWYQFRYLLASCTLAVFPREDGDREALERHSAYLTENYAARVLPLEHRPLPMESSRIRAMLPLRRGRELLDDRVYGEIIRRGFYGALPELSWLREKAYAYLDPKRVAHVAGCEAEAASLAKRWGEDPDKAATAAILHDITKKLSFEEQLNLSGRYGKLCTDEELRFPRILHAITGAALARELFGVGDDIYEAIRRHTAGRPDMSLLEKILYLADYIEPTRDFPGVEGPRALAYQDLDKALALALKNTLGELHELGAEPFEDTVQAYRWYSRNLN